MRNYSIFLGYELYDIRNNVYTEFQLKLAIQRFYFWLNKYLVKRDENE